MLHLTLAANILNAIGGTPELTRAGFVPKFPTFLPDGETDFPVGLAAFSMDTLKTFLNIEQPTKPDTNDKNPSLLKSGQVSRNKNGIVPTLKVHESDSEELHFHSIGAFYNAIEEGLEKIVHDQGEDAVFCGDHSRQITADYYYSGGGNIIPVYNLENAQSAIRLISEQGEGYGGGIFDKEGELAHFYRYQQLQLGKYYHKHDKPVKPSGEELVIDWEAVYPVLSNAKMTDYPADSALYKASLDFNQYYKLFLRKINEAYNGKPQELIPAIGGMFILKEKAIELMRNPIPGKEGVHGAPTFEIDEVTIPNHVKV
jgi:hypothetical protein